MRYTTVFSRRHAVNPVWDCFNLYSLSVHILVRCSMSCKLGSTLTSITIFWYAIGTSIVITFQIPFESRPHFPQVVQESFHLVRSHHIGQVFSSARTRRFDEIHNNCNGHCYSVASIRVPKWPAENRSKKDHSKESREFMFCFGMIFGWEGR
jgi:hypothetical protein